LPSFELFVILSKSRPFLSRKLIQISFKQIEIYLERTRTNFLKNLLEKTLNVHKSISTDKRCLKSEEKKTKNLCFTISRTKLIRVWHKKASSETFKGKQT
jgi:hypothetical protein